MKAEAGKIPLLSFVVTGLAVGLGIIYFLFDPMEFPFMPKCVFHELTGWQCIGCGSQRMLHALLHLDLPGAFRANALATLSLPFLAFLVWLEIRRKRFPRLYAKIYSVKMIYSSLVILFGWFILRNLM